MHKVAILVFQNTALFELGCAVELFGLERPEFDNWYEAEVVSFDSDSLVASTGIELKAKKIRTLDAYDTVVIPSWPVQQQNIERKIATPLIKAAAKGTRLLSFCSGAFLLAGLGLLDGKRATTHWRYARQFKESFESISYVDDVLYVYENNIGCSAGSAAALDLGIEVIRADFGYEIANKVAKRLVLSAHRSGGQTQFAETPVLASANQFGEALDWANSHLKSTIDVDLLATKANMSRRTFDRKFRASLNITPKQWLINQRISRAKNLLEAQDLSIEQIAGEAGFENSTTMRHHFRRALGVSPSQYRSQFTAS